MKLLVEAVEQIVLHELLESLLSILQAHGVGHTADTVEGDRFTRYRRHFGVERMLQPFGLLPVVQAGLQFGQVGALARPFLSIQSSGSFEDLNSVGKATGSLQMQ